ncbi:hypothetical protein C8R42DRAFT_323191 [Lentinula raphanica]|nr:hypothetical protein C8R42DRAFT_323191 [Lentinula raphanica]
MGQYWRLINIDKREASGHLGKLLEFFYHSDHVVGYLVPLILPSEYKTDTISLDKSIQLKELAQKNPSTSTSAAILLTLPVELLLLIAEDLHDDYLSLLCFSLTCSFLWEITGQTRYHSLSFTLNNKHTWAGERIILLGDWSKYLPSSMLSDKEAEELELDSQSDTPAEALSAAACDFQRPPNIEDSVPMFDKRVRKNIKLKKELTELRNDPRFGHWIWFSLSDFELRRHEGDRWMVRNFSKREYVTKAHSRNLSQMIYCLIGYSVDDWPTPKGSEWLTDGPWAGDRIDLTVASIHRQEYGNELDWKDVTAGVKQELRERAYEQEFRVDLSD